MSFSGNLEHLPIVDVIQLLNSTKKTGTLIVRREGLEYKFGFKDGAIISVTHPDTRFSLGKILLDKKILQKEILDDALKVTETLKKPLIAFLMENNLTPVNVISNALTNLVELTIVDILTWEKGTFQLTIENIDISDEFKYLSNLIHQDIFISTQNTLMEALRIFDEWRRDKLLEKGVFNHPSWQPNPENQKEEIIEISEDILGLDNIDKIERKIPNVFTGIKDVDFSLKHRKKVKDAFPQWSLEEQKKLVQFLLNLDTKWLESQEIKNIALILLSRDEFLSHLVSMISDNLGFFIFTTDGVENLPIIIKQSILKGLFPFLVIDGVSLKDDKNEDLDVCAIIDKIKEEYSQFKSIILVDWSKKREVVDYFSEGICSVFPLDNLMLTEKADNVIDFCKAFHKYLKNLSLENSLLYFKLAEFIKKTKYEKIAEVIYATFDFIDIFFNRTIAFMARKEGLISEKVKTKKHTIENFSILLPLQRSTIVYETLQNGEIYVGNYDKFIENIIFTKIGKPAINSITLIPLKNNNKIVGLIYGDTEKIEVEKSALEIFQKYTEISIENIYFRKTFEKAKMVE